MASQVCLDCYKVINHEYLHGKLHTSCMEAWFKENYDAGINCSHLPAENETADGSGESGVRMDSKNTISHSVQKPQWVN